MALTFDDVMAELPEDERERIEAAARRMAEEYRQAKAVKAGVPHRHRSERRPVRRRGLGVQ